MFFLILTLWFLLKSCFYQKFVGCSQYNRVHKSVEREHNKGTVFFSGFGKRGCWRVLATSLMPAIAIELSFQFLLPRAGITPCTEFYEILNSAHQSTLTYLRDWSTALAAAAVHPHYQVHSMPYSGCQNYVFSCFPFLNHTTTTMIWGMLVYITNVQSSQIRLKPCHF